MNPFFPVAAFSLSVSRMILYNSGMSLSEIARTRRDTFIAVTQQLVSEKQRFPTFKEYYDYLRLTKEDVMSLLADEVTQDLLRMRGISLPEESVFDPRSLAALFSYINPYDTRSLKRKLEDLGIELPEWNGWMRNPAFRGYLMNRTRELFTEDTLAAAQVKIAEGVAKGDIRHIKLFYDVKRQESEMAYQIQDTGVFLTRVIEAIQKHVKSPELIKAIAKEFEAIVENRSPVQIPGQIEGRDNDLLI